MKKEKIYSIKTTPLANEKSVIKGDKYRFTILTSRLVRIEYNESGIFEDRATQTVINRFFDTVSFTVNNSGGLLKITTDDIQITYTGKPFSQNSLKVRYIGKNSNILAGISSSSFWYFGQDRSTALPGTARTLDTIDGACELEDSIMSKGGINVLDDSESLIISADGQIEPRTEKYIDQYLFCYGIPDSAGEGGYSYDYLGCLKAFYALTGKTPLLPRFALGNWWSRYHAYTQDEYETMIKRFKREEIPFCVAVIDMDWHYVKINPKYGSGWTGYTWNKELFPNHKAFLDFLHKEGYEITLNLHPQEGVSAHEDAYEKMANAMGIDPKTKKCVEFDVTNSKFMENYFSILHHPMEDEGVTFWWIDWQQGNSTSVPGLDPLWMLNHYHYIDNGRNGKRPLTFSRYSGPGSHRYPIGFSGDTVISWASLDFQPMFTASASNIGYGWWSHDIGGHTKGRRDEELTARWVQLGTFSPVNRLHSSNSLFLGKEPWKYNKIAEISMKKFLKLRHELIPYLYTMNYRAHTFDEPLVQPLYYKYHGKEAYNHKNEFYFGTEMLVSPITRPHDSETTLGSTEIYLPEGNWFDFFGNMRYKGNRTLTVYRNLYDMPVFVKAGGIIPMAKLKNINNIENPQSMKIKVYAGASNTFELYEDDGMTNEFEDGKFAVTNMTFEWGRRPVFTISAPNGDASVIPQKRNYEIEIIGITKCGSVTAELNGSPINASCDWYGGVLTVNTENISGELKISIDTDANEMQNNITEPLMELIEHAEIENSFKDEIFHTMNSAALTTAQKLSKLYEFNISENMQKALIEIVTADTL